MQSAAQQALPPSHPRVIQLTLVCNGATKAIVNLAHGDPAAARDAVCKTLVGKLRSGTLAHKQACAQVLQHVTASPAARVPLYKLQALPGLVQVCAAGAFF